MAWKQDKPVNKPLLVAGITVHLVVSTLTWRDILGEAGNSHPWDEDSVADRECGEHARLGRVLDRRPPVQLISD